MNICEYLGYERVNFPSWAYHLVEDKTSPNVKEFTNETATNRINEKSQRIYELNAMKW